MEARGSVSRSKPGPLETARELGWSTGGRDEPHEPVHRTA
jgi:hypothetical protein